MATYFYRILCSLCWESFQLFRVSGLWVNTFVTIDCCINVCMCYSSVALAEKKHIHHTFDDLISCILRRWVILVGPGCFVTVNTTQFPIALSDIIYDMSVVASIHWITCSRFLFLLTCPSGTGIIFLLFVAS